MLQPSKPSWHPEFLVLEDSELRTVRPSVQLLIPDNSKWRT